MSITGMGGAHTHRSALRLQTQHTSVTQDGLPVFCFHVLPGGGKGCCWQWGLQAAEAAPALPGLSSPHVFSKARTTLEK